MQEDNISKWLGSELRRQQEENQLPYQLGAWEAFEKKRATKSRKKAAYWSLGIAASFVLVSLIGGVWLYLGSAGSESALPAQIALKENLTDTIEKNSDPAFSLNPPVVTEKSEENSANSTKITQENLREAKRNTEYKQTVSLKNETSKIANPLTGDASSLYDTGKLTQLPVPQIQDLSKTLAADQERLRDEKELIGSGLQEEKTTQTELPRDPQLSPEEIKEILTRSSPLKLAVGLSPGFGASQSSSQSTSGSSLGLGMMIDMDVVGGLVVGSGLAVNYLNQVSENQSYAQVAGFSSPVTEKNRIAQVQVDIPFYFKYPVTSDRTISLQAGFSNLLTFSQSAETQTSYTRQVAVSEANSVGFSTITLKTESVDQFSTLEVPQNRFYPFATANFGVNFRLFESRKTNYEVMPFYNHPLQEFSGYGEKIGLFGAVFKVNFGSVQRK